MIQYFDKQFASARQDTLSNLILFLIVGMFVTTDFFLRCYRLISIYSTKLTRIKLFYCNLSIFLLPGISKTFYKVSAYYLSTISPLNQSEVLRY